MAERERAGATALLRSVALGYDVCCRLTLAERGRFRRGHSTHSFGRLSGAAPRGTRAADEGGVRHLLLRGAAAPASLLDRDEEHIEKAFDFGAPARNGVAAARWSPTITSRGVFGDALLRATASPDRRSSRGARERYEIMNADISVGGRLSISPLHSLLELIPRAPHPSRGGRALIVPSRIWGEHTTTAPCRHLMQIVRRMLADAA